MSSGVPARPSPAPRRRWLRLAVLALLGGHVLLAGWCADHDSVTVDEFAHLPAGITYWQTGDFKLYHQNPPLVKMLAALPALTAGPRVDYRGAWRHDPPDHWAFAREFMEINRAAYFDIFVRSRGAIIALSVLGGIVVFIWAAELYGAAGGMLALALWCLGPNVLAHAHLATTDMGATVFGFVATYAFWRYLRQPTWGRAVAAGLLLGAAQLTKFSPLVLYLIWPVIWLIARWRVPRGAAAGDGRAPLRVEAIQGAVIVAVSIITINLGYGFQGTGQRLGDYEFSCKMLTRPRAPDRPAPWSRNPLLTWAWKDRETRFRDSILGSLPVPLPVHYILGFDEQKLEAEGGPGGGGYPVFLDGQLRRTGWWYYYLATLAYKVPESTWVLALLAAVTVGAARGGRPGWRSELILAVPIVAILVQMSAFTNICLGLRYVLPMFPYLFVLIGRLGPAIAGGRRLVQVVVAAALAYNLGAIVSIHPHELSYFNQVAGGPKDGFRHLLDSNIDWGQDLFSLGDWLDAHRGPRQPLGLLYFGNVDPHLLQTRSGPLRYDLPPPLPTPAQWRAMTDPARRTREPIERAAVGPQPGLFAVSVNFLQGIPYKVYDAQGRLRLVRWPENYRYFHRFQPIARAGYSILIYDLSPTEAKRVRDELLKALDGAGRRASVRDPTGPA